MDRKRSTSAVLGVSCLGLVIWLLAAALGPAAAQVRAHKTPKVTIISVTAGKPSELAFKLSRFSNLPKGTITFNVTNAGYAFHNFKLCLAPVSVITASATPNTCAGKGTKLLKHGQSVTLTVTLTKAGTYEFLCTVSGHAASGMKGLIGVAVPISAAAATAATGKGGSNTSGGGGVAVGGGGGGGECPPGTTIAQAAAGGGDHDDDDTGAATDFDGCI